MIRLPRALLPMLKARAREPGRFCLHAALARTNDDGSQHLVLTDGREMAHAVMAREDGDEVEPASSILLDCDDLASMFKVCPKKGDVRVEQDPKDEHTVGATTALKAGQVSGRIGVIDGHFPPTDAVLPTGKVRASLCLDSGRLIELLQAAKSASAGGTVRLTIHEGYNGVVIRVTDPVVGLSDFYAILMAVSREDVQGPLPRCGHVPSASAPTTMLSEVAPGVEFAPAASVAPAAS